MVTQPRSRLSRALDVLLFIVAVGIAFGAAIAVSQQGWSAAWTYWLAVPAIAIVIKFPIHLTRSSGYVEIGLETFVLAFLAVRLPVVDAVALWIIGTVIGQLLTPNAKFRAFNGSLMILSGTSAVWLVDQLRGPLINNPREAIAVVAGFTLYFFIDLVVSEVSLALDARERPSLNLLSPALLIALAGNLGVDSLGYLAALTNRLLPEAWVLVLLLVPVLTLLLAASSMSRERESARRMRILLGTSRECQLATSATAVLESLQRGMRSFVLSEEPVVRGKPPRAGELGRPVVVGEQTHWLVITRDIANHDATSLTARQGMEALASFAEDAIARLRLTAELTHNAEHDPLTGLHNRAVFLRHVEKALDVARTERSQVAVLFCDLDGFKSVNDWFGHSAGDALLAAVAEGLQSTLDQEQVVARLGGDEFAILAVDLEDDEALDRLTAKVMAAAEHQYHRQNRTLTITTSVGVAFSRGEHTADQIVRNADIAMYEAKFEGKNQVVRYHPALGRQRVRSLEMADSLREAIANRDLYLVYQPIVQSSTGTLLGLEALCRWNLDGEAIRPDVFIKIAEENGMIAALGDLVLDLVAADAPILVEAAGEPLTIGVNVSAPQLRLPEFPNKVRATRDRMAGATLLLEITERQVVSDDPLVLSVISQLEASEVPIALDDFGVGFSSIGYLQELAVQVLKIDRRFVETIDSDPRSLRLFVSMVEMGRALDLDVVIEGIERQSQVQTCWEALGGFSDWLYLQGFLLGHPMTITQTADFLRDRTSFNTYAR